MRRLAAAAATAHTTILLALASVALVVSAVGATLTPRAPNFQYFERPKYRYPYYDEHGRGRLLYGYGGSDLYQYKSYSPLEGIHWHLHWINSPLRRHRHSHHHGTVMAVFSFHPPFRRVPVVFGVLTISVYIFVDTQYH